MSTIHFTSLGCARNLVDSEIMLGLTSAAGYKAVPEPEKAEVVVVNTCGFIDVAKKESIEAVLESADLKKGACELLIVTGCLTQRYAAELQEELPEVDYFLGTGEFHRIGEILRERPGARAFHGRPNYLYDAETPRLPSGSPHSNFLKIAEGCSTRCAFCIIPKLRGPLRSRPMDSILKEARQLAAQGTVELNVIAQDSTDYGADIGLEDGLAELLPLLAEVPGIEWIRTLYCYPDKISDGLIRTLARGGKILPYVDMPIQHFDDTVLRRMNRIVTGERIQDRIQKIRDAIPGVALRTSVIVGFPGETQEQFASLMDFVEQTKFDRLGVFKYSLEEGTPAAKLDGHLPEEVKEERLAALMDLQSRISAGRLEKYRDQVVQVLIDGPHPESEHLLTGRLPTQAPEVDGNVTVALGPEACMPSPGDIVSVKISASTDHDLVGELVATTRPQLRVLG